MYSYTRAESRERGRLFRRGFRQALADNVDPKVTAKMHAIDERAKERGARELAALRAKEDADRQDVATAKSAIRTSPRSDRPAAREALRAAEKQLRRTERVVHRAERS